MSFRHRSRAYSRQPSSQPASRSPGRSLRIETLEPRQLLAATDLVILAAGLTGEESVELQIDGATVATFNNVAGNYATATGRFQSLAYTHPTAVTPGQVNVSLANAGASSGGISRSVRIDGITIDGAKYEAENSSVHSTGTFVAGQGCVPGNWQSELLHCDGGFQFANTGSVIEVLAAGKTGEEQLELQIDGVTVATYSNVAGDFDAAVYQTLSYVHTTAVAPSQVRVAFLNEGQTSGGVNRDLRVDGIKIDSVRFEAEAPDVFVDGTHVDEIGRTSGFWQTEYLNYNGHFQFASNASSGTLGLASSLITVDEDAGSAVVTVQRSGGSDGHVGVQYTTVDATATAGADYAAQTGLLVFAPGETSRSITIPILDDGDDEGDETFNLSTDLAVGGATVSVPRTATITIDDDDALTPLSSGNGLIGAYYNSANFGSFVFERTDETINFDWGGGSPDGSMGADTFSIRWTGQIEALHSETYTFRTSTDDGVRLWVDDQLIINKWIDQPVTAYTGSIDLEAGQQYDIKLEYYENGGAAVAKLRWSSPSTPLQIVPQSQLYSEPPPPSGDGLLGAYFNDQSLTEFAFERIDPRVNFTWGGGSPNSAIGADTFSVRWTGQVKPRFSETYTFRTTTDDGVRLWIDNQLIIDKWIPQPATTHAGTIALEADQLYDIRMEYNELSGDAVATLAWSSASQATQIVPKSQLFSVNAPAPSEVGTFSGQTIVAGLSAPTAIDFNAAGDMFIAEQRGMVKVHRNGQLQSTPFIDIRGEVNFFQDRGLLGLAVHPDFPSTPYVYLAYTYDPPETASRTGLAGPNGSGNRVSRLIRVTAQTDPSTGDITAVAGSEVVLLGSNSTWEHISHPEQDSTDNIDLAPSCGPDGTLQDCLPADSRTHNFGNIAFGGDGMLYVSNGDATSYGRVDPRTARVQDLNSLSGKLLRIDPITGEGLPDNPFFDLDGNTDPNVNHAKVVSYGLRNPFRFALHPESGEPYIGDVGWNTFEEVNAGSGENFGWPWYEGAIAGNAKTGGYRDISGASAFYADNNAVPPLWGRFHSQGAVAMIVGDFYTGSIYPSSYENALFVSDFGDLQLRVLRLNTDGTLASVSPMNLSVGPVVEMTMGVDGHMYFVDLSGRVGRLKFTPVGGLLAEEDSADSEIAWSATAALGDFNADSVTNGADFLAWQRGAGTAAAAEPKQGDTNADGSVDAVDLATWQLHFGRDMNAGDNSATLTSERSGTDAQQIGALVEAAPTEPFWLALEGETAGEQEALSEATVDPLALDIAKSIAANNDATTESSFEMPTALSVLQGEAAQAEDAFDAALASLTTQRMRASYSPLARTNLNGAR